MRATHTNNGKNIRRFPVPFFDVTGYQPYRPIVPNKLWTLRQGSPKSWYLWRGLDIVGSIIEDQGIYITMAKIGNRGVRSAFWNLDQARFWVMSEAKKLYLDHSAALAPIRQSSI
jgi:hypothetical protein